MRSFLGRRFVFGFETSNPEVSLSLNPGSAVYSLDDFGWFPHTMDNNRANFRGILRGINEI